MAVLLIDEDVSRSLAALLRQEGHEGLTRRGMPAAHLTSPARCSPSLAHGQRQEGAARKLRGRQSGGSVVQPCLHGAPNPL